MSDGDLPAGSYLASRYRDARRDFETRRVYYEDGRVEAFDGHEWWRVCTFTPAQTAAAKTAIRASGLTTAEDVARDGVHDTAPLSYAWRLDGATGLVTNWAYPARQHPVFLELDHHLDALESAAGAE